jgi:hypothetical protein
MKLANIILESKSLYKIDVLIKTVANINKVTIYNEIRGITGVVVVTVEQSAFLDSKKTDKFEYSLLHLKYLVNSDPKSDIDAIKMDALQIHKISGLLQFIPRYTTTQLKGKY